MKTDLPIDDALLEAVGRLVPEEFWGETPRMRMRRVLGVSGSTLRRQIDRPDQAPDLLFALLGIAASAGDRESALEQLRALLE